MDSSDPLERILAMVEESKKKKASEDLRMKSIAEFRESRLEKRRKKWERTMQLRKQKEEVKSLIVRSTIKKYLETLVLDNKYLVDSVEPEVSRPSIMPDNSVKKDIESDFIIMCGELTQGLLIMSGHVRDYAQPLMNYIRFMTKNICCEPIIEQLAICAMEQSMFKPVSVNTPYYSHVYREKVIIGSYLNRSRWIKIINFCKKNDFNLKKLLQIKNKMLRQEFAYLPAINCLRDNISLSRNQSINKLEKRVELKDKSEAFDSLKIDKESRGENDKAKIKACYKLSNDMWLEGSVEAISEIMTRKVIRRSDIRAASNERRRTKKEKTLNNFIKDTRKTFMTPNYVGNNKVVLFILLSLISGVDAQLLRENYDLSVIFEIQILLLCSLVSPINDTLHIYTIAATMYIWIRSMMYSVSSENQHLIEPIYVVIYVLIMMLLIFGRSVIAMIYWEVVPIRNQEEGNNYAHICKAIVYQLPQMKPWSCVAYYLGIITNFLLTFYHPMVAITTQSLNVAQLRQIKFKKIDKCDCYDIGQLFLGVVNGIVDFIFNKFLLLGNLTLIVMNGRVSLFNDPYIRPLISKINFVNRIIDLDQGKDKVLGIGSLARSIIKGWLDNKRIELNTLWELYKKLNTILLWYENSSSIENNVLVNKTELLKLWEGNNFNSWLFTTFLNENDQDRIKDATKLLICKAFYDYLIDVDEEGLFDESNRSLTLLFENFEDEKYRIIKALGSDLSIDDTMLSSMIRSKLPVLHEVFKDFFPNETRILPFDGERSKSDPGMFLKDILDKYGSSAAMSRIKENFFEFNLIAEYGLSEELEGKTEDNNIMVRNISTQTENPNKIIRSRSLSEIL